MQGPELSGLWVKTGRPPQPWVVLEVVGKASIPVGKAALAQAAVKAALAPAAVKAALAHAAVKVEDNPPPAPPQRLNFESDHEGCVCGQKRRRQPSSSSSSSSSSTTSSSEGRRR